MVNYIIQVILFQLLFLAVYDIFLRKETFYNWNRAYLLATPLLSFAIPFVKIDTFSKITPIAFAEQLPLIIINPEQSISKTLSFDMLSYLPSMLLTGMGVMLLLFLYKLTSIFLLRHRSKAKKREDFTLVIIDKPSVVFSFFSFIFMDKAFLEQKNDHIISHEMVHIKNYHSIDLLLFEALKIVSWFIPTIFIFQNRMAELHEFIADSKTIEPQNKQAFFNNLLAMTFKLTPVDFINQFYKHSLIKKRIIMANKNNSKQVLKLKYLLLVPAMASMLFYSSCEQKKPSIEEQVATLKATIAEKDTLKLSETKEIMSLVVSLSKKTLNMRDSTSVKKLEIQGVPFAVIEKGPIYPGCEDIKDQKKCFSSKIISLITQHFDTDLANDLGLKSGKKRYSRQKGGYF